MNNNLNLIKAEKYDEILPYFLFVVDDLLSFPFEQNIQDTLSRLDNLIQYGCNVVFMVKEDVNLNKLDVFLFGYVGNVSYLYHGTPV